MMLKAKYKSYPKYKKSRVDWIGEVPEGWEVRKVKYSAPSQKIKAINSDYRIALENIESFTGRFVKSDSSFEGEGIAFDENSILYGKLRPYLCKVFLPDGKGLCVSEFLVLWPVTEIADKKFLFYYFLSYLFTDVINGVTFGSKMPRADWRIVGGFRLFLPPLSEQRAIASFLDRQTSRIDALIGKQRRLIELLKEKRAATITHAVTRGLDPNAKMKESGVEWIGEIPEGWEVRKVRKSLIILTDFTANGSFASLAENVEYLPEGYSRLIRLTDLRKNLQNEGIYVNESAHSYLKKSELSGGEILIANVGAYTGLVCIMPFINGKATLGPNMYLLKFRNNFFNKYIFYLLSSTFYFNLFQIKAGASAQPKINKKDVKDEPILKPPLPEQRAIAAFLDRETARIDTLIGKIERQIELLNEYRQSLITAAVTGTIDVRDEANETPRV